MKLNLRTFGEIHHGPNLPEVPRFRLTWISRLLHAFQKGQNFYPSKVTILNKSLQSD